MTTDFDNHIRELVADLVDSAPPPPALPHPQALRPRWRRRSLLAALPLAAAVAATGFAVTGGGRHVVHVRTTAPVAAATPGPVSTPSTTVLRTTEITYWGPLTTSYDDSNTGLELVPPPSGAAPAITWQQAAEPCVQTTGTNNCSTPTSPENVYLALGSDKNFGAIGPEPTLMYVINENQLCSSAGNGPPARPDPTSTTTAPKIAPCTYLAFVNAATGQGMGAMSGPGLKRIPSQ